MHRRMATLGKMLVESASGSGTRVQLRLEFPEGKLNALRVRVI